MDLEAVCKIIEWRPSRRHKVFVSERSDIKPKEVKNLLGRILMEDMRIIGRPPRNTSGVLYFIDMEPKKEWPHKCRYLLIEPGAKLGFIGHKSTLGWPPSSKIRFVDPNGSLAVARRGAKMQLTSRRV